MLVERARVLWKVSIGENHSSKKLRKEIETKKRAIRRWLPGRDDKVHNPLAYQRIVTKDNAKVKKNPLLNQQVADFYSFSARFCSCWLLIATHWHLFPWFRLRLVFPPRTFRFSDYRCSVSGWQGLGNAVVRRHLRAGEPASWGTERFRCFCPSRTPPAVCRCLRCRGACPLRRRRRGL